MPIVDITLIEGRTPEAKARLIAKVTDAVVEAVSAPRESVRVILREVPAAHFGVAGIAKDSAIAKASPVANSAASGS